MINWGIVGTGYISTLMANDFKFVKEGKIVAVSGTSIEKAKNFAKQYGIDKYYGDLESLLADETIDVVYIATPHPSHKDIAIASMRAKKAVLCEKPLGVNKQEELEMIKVAKEENVFLMEGFWTLYLPAIIKAFEWIKEGKIGKLRLIEADFSFMTDQDETGRLLNPNLAGGALLDVGIYPVGISHSIAKMVGAGEVVEESIISQKASSGVDGQNCINFQYKNGLSAHLTCGVTLDGLQGLMLYGEKGRIEIPVFFATKKATLHVDGDRLDYKSNTEATGYCHEVNAVNELLSNGQKSSDVVSLEHSLEVIERLDSLRSKINLKYPFE